MNTPVIVSPLITEKSMGLVGKHSFTFLVRRDADKEAIKKAVENAFNVHVTDVVTVTVKGQTKRVGVRRTEKKVTPVKKAVVTLKENEKIDLFELGS